MSYSLAFSSPAHHKTSTYLSKGIKQLEQLLRKELEEILLLYLQAIEKVPGRSRKNRLFTPSTKQLDPSTQNSLIDQIEFRHPSNHRGVRNQTCFRLRTRFEYLNARSLKSDSLNAEGRGRRGRVEFVPPNCSSKSPLFLRNRVEQTVGRAELIDRIY